MEIPLPVRQTARRLSTTVTHRGRWRGSTTTKADSCPITVNRLRRKPRDTHRNVLRPVRPGRAVPHPCPARRDHGLARVDLEHAVSGLYPQGAAKHDCVFIELRCLPR